MKPAPQTEPRVRRFGAPRDEVILLEGGVHMNTSPPVDSLEKRSDRWDPCVRDLIQRFDPAIRDDLGDALTSFTTTCTRDEQRITFEPPRKGRTYLMESHIGFAGTITPARHELALRIVVRGAPPQRLTILVDGTRWTSPVLEVVHDKDVNCELAALPYTRSLAKVVERILDADGAVLRFESSTGFEDVLVTAELAGDLELMIGLLDPP